MSKGGITRKGFHDPVKRDSFLHMIAVSVCSLYLDVKLTSSFEEQGYSQYEVPDVGGSDKVTLIRLCLKKM
ncbi:hypothetical protein RJT34_19742 [Clitoria ternatea]|uniref:Uncharacterized protein n=1 Tax=Clitoria ternatea TaxID=43366 RepID=A0AAN9P476_CLITE